MKFYFSQHSENQRNWQSRCVWMTEVGGTETEAESNAEKVKKILKSPYSFDALGIKMLESQELLPEDKSKLNYIAEFHISLIGSGSDMNFPSRILFELEHSKLWKFINPSLKLNIKAVISHEMKKASEFVDRGIGSLTSSDLTNMTRLYRFMRNGKNKNTEVFQKLSEKLIEKTQKIIKDYQVQKFESDIFVGNLNPRDRLFVLEALELFPEEIELEKINKSHVLQTIGASVVKTLKQDLESGNFANRLEYLPLWEVLASVESSIGKNETLQAMIKQSQAAQFMGWIEYWQSSGKSVLLPEHIKALQDIKKDAEDLKNKKDLNKIVGNYENTKEGKIAFEKFLTQWEKEQGRFHKKKRNSDGKEILTEINLEKAREDYKKNFEEPEAQISAFTKNRDRLKSETLIERFLNQDIEDGGVKQLWESSYFSKDESVIRGNFDDFKRNIVQSASVTGSIYEKLRKRITDKAHSLGFTDDEEKKLRSLITGFGDEPLGAEFESKRTQAQKDIDEDLRYIQKEDDRISSHVELARRLFYKGEKSQEYLDVYKKQLQGRVDNRRLEPADLAVLFEREKLKNSSNISDADFVSETEDILNSEDKLTKTILEFRNKFKEKILDGFLNKVDGNALSSTSGFKNWLQELSNEAIVKETDLTDILEELKYLLSINENNRGSHDFASSLTIKEIIDVTKASFRDEIMDKISPLLIDETTGKVNDVLGNNRQEELQNFLNYTDRTHGGLYDLEQDYKEKKFEKYVADKKSFEGFEDGLKQRNHEAVGGVTREKIIERIFTGLKGQVPKEKIEANFIISSEVLKDILKGDLTVLENVLKSISSDIKPIFDNASTEDKENFLKEIGNLLLQEEGNKNFNDVVESKTNYLFQGNDDFIGFETMNDMTLQLTPLGQEIKVIEGQLESKVSNLSKKIRSGETINFSVINSSLIQYWNGVGKSRLNYIADDAEFLLNNIFPEEKEGFNKIFIAGFKDKIKFFQHYVDSFVNNYQGKELEGKASAKDLDDILVNFNGIVSSFEIDTGQFHEMQTDASEMLRHMPDTLKFIKDDLGLLEVGGKEKAEKNFLALKKKYQVIVDAYIERSEKAGTRMEKDLEKLSSEDFQTLYGMDKNKGIKHLEDLKSSVFNILSNFSGDEALKNFEGKTGWTSTEPPAHNELTKTGFFQKGYFNQWFDEYSSEDPNRMNQAISDMNLFSGIANNEYMAPLKKEGIELGRFNKDYDEYLKDKSKLRKPLRMWNNFKKIKWQWYSIIDIYQMGVDFFEIWERDRKRQQEQAVAFLGSKIFGDSVIGKEFFRKAEEAEEARIGEYKKRMEDQSENDWWQVIYRSNNQDEIRGMIDLLNEAGHMRWDDPGLLRTFNRIQKSVYFNLPEDIDNIPYTALSEKVKIACTDLWSKKVFDNWDTTIEGNLKKGIDNHERKYRNLTADLKMKGELSSILKRWESGDTENPVDPIEFASYIYNAFKQGEVNGPSDPRWYFLIVGSTLKNPEGKTLLPKDFFFFLKGELRSTVPNFDFFGENSGDHWMLNGRLVPIGTPGGHPASEGWNHQDIQGWVDFLQEGVSSFDDMDTISRNSVNFFYQFVSTSPLAKVRVTKQSRNLSADSDHDDAWMLSSNINYTSMVQALNKRSEGNDLMTQEWTSSFLHGFPMTIEKLYEDIRKSEDVYGDHPEWERVKKEKLLEIGERLRIGFAAAQTLAGNFHDNGQTNPSTLDVSYWEDPNSDANQSRNYLTDFVGGLVGSEINGFSSVKGFVGVKEHGTGNYGEIKLLDGFNTVNRAISKATSSTAFKDTNKIEILLKKQFGSAGQKSSTASQRQAINWDAKNIKKAA